MKANLNFEVTFTFVALLVLAALPFAIGDYLYDFTFCVPFWAIISKVFFVVTSLMALVEYKLNNG